MAAVKARGLGFRVGIAKTCFHEGRSEAEHGGCGIQGAYSVEL